MGDPLDAAFLALQREYLASMPTRLEELRADLATVRQGGTEAAVSLKARLHRLAGSGGSFGFLDLSTIAREGEHFLGSHPGLQDPDAMALILDRLEEAVRRSDAQLDATAEGKPPEVIPRALLVMRPSPQRERIAQELRGAG